MHKEYRILLGIPSAVLVFMIIVLTLDAAQPQNMVEASVSTNELDPYVAYLPTVVYTRRAEYNDTLLIYTRCYEFMPPPPLTIFYDPPLPCQIIDATGMGGDMVLYEGVVYQIYYSVPGNGYYNIQPGVEVQLVVNQWAIEDVLHEMHQTSTSQAWCHEDEQYCWYPHSLQVIPLDEFPGE